MGLLQLGELDSDNSVSHLLGLHELVSLVVGEFSSLERNIWNLKRSKERNTYDGSLSDLLGPLGLLEVLGNLGGIEGSGDSLGSLSDTDLGDELDEVEVLQVSDGAADS